MEDAVGRACETALSDLNAHISVKLTPLLQEYPSHHSTILERIDEKLEEVKLSLKAQSDFIFAQNFAIDSSFLQNDFAIWPETFTINRASVFDIEHSINDHNSTDYDFILEDLTAEDSGHESNETTSISEHKFKPGFQKWLDKVFFDVPSHIALRASNSSELMACLGKINLDFPQTSLRNFVSAIVFSIASQEAFAETTLALHDFRGNITPQLDLCRTSLASQIYELRQLEKQQKRSQLIRRVLLIKLQICYGTEAQEYGDTNGVTPRRARSAILIETAKEYSQIYDKRMDAMALTKSFQNYLTAGNFWRTLYKGVGIAAVLLLPIKGAFRLETQRLEQCPKCIVRRVVKYLRKYRRPFLFHLNQKLHKDLLMTLAREFDSQFRFAFEKATDTQLQNISMDSDELLELAQLDTVDSL